MMDPELPTGVMVGYKYIVDEHESCMWRSYTCVNQTQSAQWNRKHDVIEFAGSSSSSSEQERQADVAFRSL